MNVCVFSMHRFEQPFLECANKTHGHALTLLEASLNEATAPLAKGHAAVCVFANDRPNAAVLEQLAAGGTRLLALRSAGFNHVSLEAAERLGLTVARVPAYSPRAVAEHGVALMLTLNRKIHRAHARVREGNFLLDGLMGFDMGGKTVGIVGTGRIGAAAARILAGFGCELLGFDPYPNPECAALGLRYVDLDTLLAQSHIITLHCPLTPKSRHLIDQRAVERMRRGVMLINTGRGALVDTRALIGGLKSGHIGSLGLDVYEEEENIFFRDLSDNVIQDDVFARLLTFSNVIVTAHQGFFTHEAVEQIETTTLQNITDFERGQVRPENLVTLKMLSPKPG